jgi:sialidase-1
MPKNLSAQHRVVCRLPGEYLSYFGWPTVERFDDGKLIVASSGLRSWHRCPWGKTILNTSTDDGATWSPPRVIHDSPLDDRDAGILNLGGDKILVTWASPDMHRQLKEDYQSYVGAAEIEKWRPTIEALTDEQAAAHVGSWYMLSTDGGQTWNDKARVPVYAPHGPIRMRDGTLMYLGRRFVIDGHLMIDEGPVIAARSGDDGRTWTEHGTVPLFPNTEVQPYSEPSIVELPSGRLLGMIRVSGDLGDSGVLSFSMMQVESDDGGESWSVPQPLNFPGAPPHLLQHSSGVLILSYGYRLVPFGQRVALSYDDGATWEHDWILRDDGPDWDLGYPSTVELADGSLYSVYYQKVAGDPKCSLLSSRWRLP